MTKMLVLGYGMSEFWLRGHDASEQVKLNFNIPPSHIPADADGSHGPPNSCGIIVRVMKKKIHILQNTYVIVIYNNQFRMNKLLIIITSIIYITKVNVVYIKLREELNP